MRLLAIDDDIFILELLQEALSLNGYDDVTCATSAQDALEKIALSDSRFDAIFVDIQMPGMDGIELCSRIRAERRYFNVPLIMVTAMHDKEYVNRAFAAGANDYITKPFDVFELGVRLRNNLALRDAKRRAYGDVPLGALTGKSTWDNVERFDAAETLDGMVSRQTLENYLKQLNRCSDEHSVVALKIANIAELEANLTERAFEMTLSDCARVLKNHFAGENCLTGYVAYGTFICVYEGPSAFLDNFFRASLESAINETCAEGGARVDVRIGRAIRCRRFLEVDGMKTMREAIDSISEKVRPQVDHFRVPSRPSLSIDHSAR